MLEEMDMGVSCGLGAGPVIWGVRIHKCPKREWTASFEHVACVGNGPRKTTSMGRQARGSLHSSAGFYTGLLALTASGFHPISVPGQFSDPVPSKWNDKLTNMWNRNHFVVVARNDKY